MDNKILTGIIIGTLLLLGGTVLMASKMASSAKVEMAEGAQVEVSETAWDWGEIGINDGNVEKEFEIKNIGSETLKLFNVSTSCMCTTARFVDGEPSPEFGMHTKSSYVKEILPGETARMKVVYDPLYHGPDGVGPINRQVTMMTNDPDRSKINFMLTTIVRR